MEMRVLYWFFGIIGLAILVLVGVFTYSVIRFIYDEDVYMDLPVVHTIDHQGVGVGFSLPRTRLYWPIRIRDNSFEEYTNQHGEIRLYLKNTGTKSFVAERIDLDDHLLYEEEVLPGSAVLVYEGELSELITKLPFISSDDRIIPKNAPHGMYGSWSVVTIKESPKARKIKGPLILESDEKIEINPPIQFYFYLRADTL